MISKSTNRQSTIESLRARVFAGRSLLAPVDSLAEIPLKNYLLASADQARILFEQRTVGDQGWQSPAWDFGRFAKAHPLLINLDENAALKIVRDTLGPKFWERTFKLDPADAEMAFDDIWIKCRAVPGYDPLTTAVMDAKKYEHDSSQPAGYSTFIRVANALRYQLNGKPFMLPCRKLAPMMGCSAITISRYRQKAIREGRIRIVKEHRYSSQQGSEATEFEFLK